MWFLDMWPLAAIGIVFGVAYLIGCLLETLGVNLHDPHYPGETSTHKLV